MSHTISTAITFPIVLGCVSMLLWSGPVMYESAADAAEVHVLAILHSLDNQNIYLKKTIVYEGESFDIVCTSPERMHFLVRAVKDSATILVKGVTSS